MTSLLVELNHASSNDRPKEIDIPNDITSLVVSPDKITAFVRSGYEMDEVVIAESWQGYWREPEGTELYESVTVYY